MQLENSKTSGKKLPDPAAKVQESSRGEVTHRFFLRSLLIVAVLSITLSFVLVVLKISPGLPAAYSEYFYNQPDSTE